jgi:hypothetical protein
VDSAVMLHAKLQAGLHLPQVIALTRSLGRKVSAESGDGPEVFVWRDAGDDEVEVTFVAGRCTQWTLRRHRAAELTDGGGASP